MVAGAGFLHEYALLEWRCARMCVCTGVSRCNVQPDFMYMMVHELASEEK